MKKYPWIGKVLGRVGAGLSALLLIAVFYVAVVLGHPQQEEGAVQVLQNQPLLAGSPAVNLARGDDPTALLVTFPAPVLHAPADSGATLVQAASYDVAFENGFARMADLTYEASFNGETRQWSVRTIYPARAISLVEKGSFRMASATAQTVAGQSFIRMENADTLRLHAQGSEAVYLITLPKEAAANHPDMLRTLQLYVKEAE